MTEYYGDVQMGEVAFIPPSSYGRNDDERKLFLGGLSWDTNEQDIFSYFSKFGQVDNVNIKYDNVTGKPRGFGFITFSSDTPIEAVLQGGPHVIRNKNVDPKRTRSKPAFKKIFVGGVDADMPEEEIISYFGRFGNVEGIECPFDRQKGKRREFCFIIFDSEEAAEAAVNEPKQIVGNKECDIKIAQPQHRNQQQQQSRNNSNTGQSSSGYGFGSRIRSSNGYSSNGYSSNGYQNGYQNGFQKSHQGYHRQQGFQQPNQMKKILKDLNGGVGNGSYYPKTYTNSNYYLAP